MNRKRFYPRQQGRRKGFGRAIYLELPLDSDEALERVRARRGFDRAGYVRFVVMAALEAEEKAS